MQPLWKFAVMLAVVVMLAGCWDLKNPQDINYFTAIGFDYVDGQYVVYVQAMDFSAIAKVEEGKPQDPSPAWTGTGKGVTAVDAVNSLYDTAQLGIFYGHVNAIVYSENVMKNKRHMQSIWDAHNRYYEMRYTPWLFGTTVPIEELFSTNSFFSLPSMLTMLHQPQESYKQQSVIPPVSVREFASRFREPGNTALIPSLTTESGNWKKDMKPDPMLAFEGIYMFHNEKYAGNLNKNDLLGLRWVEPETARAKLTIRSGEEIIGLVSLEQPKIKITPRVHGENVNYRLEVRIPGRIMETVHPASESEMEKEAARLVQAEIEHTFAAGLKHGADLLHLEHELYRKQNKAWQRLRDEGKLTLVPEQLEIDVTINLLASGKRKMD